MSYLELFAALDRHKIAGTAIKVVMKQPFNPGNRTHHVSDERLRAFTALTPGQCLGWVEELANFLRLAKAGKQKSSRG
jgi:hypothetical protein